MKRIKLPEVYKGIKDVNGLFDLICARNYFAGHFDVKMPVDESRQAFEWIKQKLTPSPKE